jgi:hypothetical protein
LGNAFLGSCTAVQIGRLEHSLLTQLIWGLGIRLVQIKQEDENRTLKRAAKRFCERLQAAAVSTKCISLRVAGGYAHGFLAIAGGG